MSNIEYDELIVLPSLAARMAEDGGLILTDKYLSGMRAYAEHWPGRVTSLVRVTNRPSTDMDLSTIDLSTVHPRVEIRPTNKARLSDRIRSAALVLAGFEGDELPLAKLCSELKVPIVFNSEFTLATEKQIIDADTKNPVLRARRKLWAYQNHRRRMLALKYATSLQCSGTPTYFEYVSKVPDALLFFDNRVSKSDAIEKQSLASRLSTIGDRPLRIAYGGRFVPMKGVQDLPRVAEYLKRSGLDFSMSIVGSGPLEKDLRQQLQHKGLEQQVKLFPPMDFKSSWIPFLREQVDLFVCCHKQGDPSSTYPEVMSCGVPIVGYDNAALRGIVERSGSGWISSPNPISLADLIIHIANKAKLTTNALRAREFALEHVFEQTFFRRVEHMVCASRLPEKKMSVQNRTVPSDKSFSVSRINQND